MGMTHLWKLLPEPEKKFSVGKIFAQVPLLNNMLAATKGLFANL